MPAPDRSIASDVIDAVNAIRSAQGLAPFQPNDILMSVAQAQAEYMAAISSSVAETDAQGRRGYQRAIAAGYQVAGLVSNTSPGWFSELHDGGGGWTAKDAVDWWYNETVSHRPTLLSSELVDVGVGVANVGNTYYFCLDAGRSTGGTPVAYTLPAPLHPDTPTFIPNTPNADGSITYIVQPGDTALGIAIAYGVSYQDFLALNGLTDQSIIYAGKALTIRAAYTATPTEPTATNTTLPTITPWPTASLTSTGTVAPPPPPPTPGV
ncbi:MAG TPA: CAP domain-containing protein, partial [Anaerolineales bacterium]|nr:CAP domain-containing protein [Anaerolineales bacterium]